jgi:hypothetical protein
VKTERLSEIRASLNSTQRVFDPWPNVVQELFDEVCRLHGERAARVDAALRLAASVCEDRAARHRDRYGGDNMPSDEARSCAAAILALLERTTT